MKSSFRVMLVTVVCILFLSFSMGFAANKKRYPATPPAKIAKKWRIGYLEGGPYMDYQSNLLATLNGLAELGWIEKISLPPQENNEDTDKIWAWIAANAKSSYLEFVADAYYSNSWDKELREKTKQTLLKRLNEKKDIDLMLAVGTWAGQDLANTDHSVPTVICSVADALAAKIVKSAEDSGYDHVIARLDPTRYQRQIIAFHDVIGFKKLGVTYENTMTGRSYAAIGDVEKIAKERNFEVIACYTKEDTPDKKESEASIIQCANELAPKIEAFYITASNGINPESLPKILAPMNKYKIPTFVQMGSAQVRQGVLLSVSRRDFSPVGRFYAETIGKIINGAKPRDLPQIFSPPVKIAFNKATAKIIDLRDDIYDLILGVADEVYDTIETGK